MRTAIPIATTRRSSAAIGAAVGAGGGAGTVLIDGQNATSLPRGTAFTIRSGTFELASACRVPSHLAPDTSPAAQPSSHAHTIALPLLLAPGCSVW